MSCLISVDPGRSKCGLILVDVDAGKVLLGQIVEANYVLDVIIEWIKLKQVQELILGNGTSSTYWNEKLKGIISVTFVEERGTTLRARNRFFELWPPIGLKAWMPKGLLSPSEDLDAVAALILVEDFTGKKFIWPGIPNFRNLP